MQRLRFMHIPKTAGLTFQKILFRQYRGQPHFSFTGKNISDLQRYRQLPESERKAIRLFLGHMPLITCDEEVDSTTTITFLREPISRVKSLCQYVSEGYWQDYMPGPFDLDEFLNSGDQQLFNQQTKFLINHGDDGSTNLINSMSVASARDLALENLCTRVARFGLQKYFDESLMIFAHFLHWTPPYYFSVNQKDARRLLQFKQCHIDRIMELNAIDMEVYKAAEKKFHEVMEQNCAAMAQLKRFRSMNAYISPVLKFRDFLGQTIRRSLRTLRPVV